MIAPRRQRIFTNSQFGVCCVAAASCDLGAHQVRRHIGSAAVDVADDGLTVVLSSHLLSDVERVCDHLIVLAGGRVQLQGPVDDLLASHKVLTGARRDLDALPRDQTLVRATHTDRQTTALVRTTEPVLDPRWDVAGIGLEDLVLAYMSPSNERHGCGQPVDRPLQKRGEVRGIGVTMIASRRDRQCLRVRQRRVERVRVRNRNVLRYYARSIDHLLESRPRR